MDKITFKLGDFVKCKKWNGETMLGTYAYKTKNNTHFVIAENSTRWIIKENDIKKANQKEIKHIKQQLGKNIEKFNNALKKSLKRKDELITSIKRNQTTTNNTTTVNEEELIEIMTT